MEQSQEIKIEIYDPPMCCPGGLCGPAIDPELLDVNEALIKIKQELDGRVSVNRYLLSQQAAKFMQNREVLKILQSEGTGALPITVINGQLCKKGKYPTYQELLSAIGRQM